MVRMTTPLLTAEPSVAEYRLALIALRDHFMHRYFRTKKEGIYDLPQEIINANAVIDRPFSLTSVSAQPRAKPWLPAVPAHPEPMMAWSNLERLRIEEYGRECFASGAASVKPFDPEALIRAVLPGGHSCDPQAVADDIREWARAHGIDAARLREALEKIASMNGSIPAIVSVARAALAESATTGKDAV